MNCKTANFWVFLSNSLVHSQFHQNSGMEAEIRQLVIQQVALAKNSVLINRGKIINMGENTETGYILKKG